MWRPVLLLSLIISQFALAEDRKSPAELDAHLQKIAPELVDATVAIMMGQGSGSGVIVSPDGLVITAAHVTGKSNQSVTVLLADGRQLPATSLGVDHKTDGALLQINAPGPFPFRPYIKEKNYDVGDWVIATGHPGGPIVGRPSPIRLGRITAAGVESGFADPIISSAPVISGDSGGPLFNLAGDVIGINSNISMQWTSNRHVPLPSIIAQWDALMAGENIGNPQDPNALQQEDFFDEPYRHLRQQFNDALSKRPEDDAEAAELRARPRLLDPHHMQAYLDRWEPEEEAPLKPFLGLQFDLTHTQQALISGVTPGSPAEKVGLKKGDVIHALNDTPVTSPTSFALALQALKLSPDGNSRLILHKGSDSAFVLKPDFIPERRHFPMPLAGLIPMMVTDDAPQEAPPSIRKLRKEFLAPLEPLKESLAATVVPIYQGSKLITHATSVTGHQLITKASELDKKENLKIHFEDETYPITIVATDKTRDLALISADIEGLYPISLKNTQEPEVASLVFTPSEKGLISGVITQPMRTAPAAGYDLNVNTKQSSGYVGISLSPDNIQPTISQVELGSPADTSGLLEGDVITHLQGKEIENSADLTDVLSKHSPGEKITFKVKRNDQELSIPLILDVRPAQAANQHSRRAAGRDQQLSSLTARGGTISKRKDDFPLALYHDQLLSAPQMGTPLIDHKGQVLGINIARSLRQRTLAIPTSEIIAFFREQLSKDRSTD